MHPPPPLYTLEKFKMDHFLLVFLFPSCHAEPITVLRDLRYTMTVFVGSNAIFTLVHV